MILHYVLVGISDKDRKVLWGRSGNRCALCRRVLVAERTVADREAVVGDEAHIAARSPGGPRYGECPPEVVDSYENLILLCRVDHKKVDDQAQHYTADRLRQLKAEHETWVEHALGDVPGPVRSQHTARDTGSEGQVVTGNVPWSPPYFQQPLMLPRLAEASDSPEVFAITGQRGVGKTQLAAAYARQRIADGWVVAWIAADTEASLAIGILELAEALGTRSVDEPFDVNARRVRDRLRSMVTPALVIFDNVTDVAMVSEYLPVPGRVQVILTSTSRAAERLGTGVAVNMFDQAASVTYLRAATGLDDDSGAVELAVDLGGLPLALAQAAARIREVDHSYAVYLDRLRSLPLERYLTKVDGDHYPQGTAQAILLALEPVEHGDDLARLMLNALAAMSPDGVDRVILTDPAPDPVVLDDTLGKLYRASLIDYAGDSRESVRLHRLVRRVVQERDVWAGSITQTAQVAAHLLSWQTFDKDDAWGARTWGDKLVRHIDAVWTHVGDHVTDENVLARVLGLKNWTVEYLTAIHSFDRAIAAGHDALTACSAAFGEDHLGPQIAMTYLANAYSAASWPHKAIPFYEQALATARRVRGSDDPQTLEVMLGLASAYKEKSRIDEAINLFEEALATYRGLGDEVQAMGAQLNLAGAFDAAGRTKDAILLYERALTDCVRLLGEDHPDTLGAINNLAAAYQSAGAIDKSISMLEQVSVGNLEVLGDDHPNTLMALHNLADGYFKAGRLEEAFALLADNVKKCKEVFQSPNLITVSSAALLLEVKAAIDRTEGTDRNDDMTSLDQLATDHTLAGRLDEAIPLYEQSLAQRLRMLGADHPDTMATRSNLATAFMLAGRTDGAITLHQQVLADRERVLGPAHPDTMDSRNALGHAYVYAGRASAAIPLHEQTLRDRLQKLGPEHPDTLQAHENVANAYMLAGRLDDAIRLHEQTLAKRHRILGKEHAATLSSCANLAFAYLSAGQLDEAIELYEPTLTLCESVLGPDHAHTVTVRNSLASAYEARG